MKRTFWPFGILLVIVFGILLLVALVYISLKQPNVSDNAYLQPYREVEQNVDALLPDSKLFLQHYEVFISVGERREYPEHRLIAPYEVLASKMSFSPLALKVGKENELFLTLRCASKATKQGSLQNPPCGTIKILGYRIFASRYYDKDYKARVDLLLENGAVESLPTSLSAATTPKTSALPKDSATPAPKALALQAHPSPATPQASQPLDSATFTFLPSKIGRYKLTLALIFMQDSKPRTIYLQRDFVARD